jgi:hypothetical protein
MSAFHPNGILAPGVTFFRNNSIADVFGVCGRGRRSPDIAQLG